MNSDNQNKNKNMSDKKSSTVYLTTKLEPPKVQKFKQGTRIQFINQNLQQAIHQMKNTIKNKSKSNLYSTGTKEHSNPQRVIDGVSESEKLFYTETYKKKMQERKMQIEQRRKQLNARSLDKQMKARLLRKIQENTELKEKMDLLKDIQEKRDLLILQKTQREKRRKEEEQLFHSSSRINAEMLRKSKKKNMKQELKDSRLIEQESHKEHVFKNYLTQKQKQEKHMLNMSRHQFLIRNRSSQGLRGQPLLTSRSHRVSNSSITRPIKTSHLSRKKDKNYEQQEQQIIEQYRQCDKESNVSSNKQGKLQKKYNSAIRQSEAILEEKDILRWEARWNGEWELRQLVRQTK